jgi:methylaspartate mutase sigma subunit
MSKEKKEKKAEKAVLILGAIGSDIHYAGIQILEHAFIGARFEVINIGVRRPPEKFIQTAKKYKANAIIVSSLYGQAGQDCEGMRQKCIEFGLDDILLYIGGKLVVGDDLPPWQEIEKQFKDYGFNRVYPAERDSVSKAIIDLRKDLGLDKKRKKGKAK